MPKTKPVLLNLVALQGESMVRQGVAAGIGEGLPDRLVVAPWGSHDIGERGKAIVNQTTLSRFAASMAAMKLDRVALDFNHNSLPGHPSYLAEKEPRKIAAYGIPTVEDGVGIVLSSLTWTPEGKAAFEGGHFQDLSPTVFRLADGTVVALHSAALCQHGEINGLTIESATASALTPLFDALSASLPPSPPMKPTILTAFIALCSALGVTVAPDADDAALEAALTDLAAKIDALKPAAASATVNPELTALNARLTVVEAERDTIVRDRLKEQATAAGKVIPLSDEVWNLTPLTVCTALVAGLQAGAVPLQRKTPTGEITATTPDALSAESIANLAKFGVSPEDAAKYAK